MTDNLEAEVAYSIELYTHCTRYSALTAASVVISEVRAHDKKNDGSATG